MKTNGATSSAASAKSTKGPSSTPPIMAKSSKPSASGTPSITSASITITRSTINTQPRPWSEKIEAVERKFRKPVLFTEAGFGAHQNSHREPWEDETTKPLDLAEQARGYEGLLSAVYKKPWFRGVYWWKVGTNGYGGPDNNSMTPWRKPAMDVVRRFYLLPAP